MKNILTLVVLGLIFSSCGGGSSDIPVQGSVSGSQSLNGTYVPQVTSGDACFGDETDVDELWIEVVNGKITEFELDDDNEEVVKSASESRIDFYLIPDSSYGLPAGSKASCNLKLSGNIAQGDCKFDGKTCQLKYKKCSDVFGINEGDKRCVL